MKVLKIGTLSVISLEFEKSGFTIQYSKDPKFSDRQVLANSADPDLHCLQFCLHLLDTLLYSKYSLFSFRVITANFSDVRSFRSFTVVDKNGKYCSADVPISGAV